MREKNLEYYLSCFKNLRRASRNGEMAPHKTVVLLTVIHEVERGNISSNFISLSSKNLIISSENLNALVGPFAVITFL